MKNLSAHFRAFVVCISLVFNTYSGKAQWLGTDPLYTTSSFCKVGIGISTPLAHLHISRNLTGLNPIPADAPFIRTQQINTSGVLDSPTVFTVYNTGDVVIGTVDDPLAKLHLKGIQYIDGKLGIGVYNPTHAFHLKNASGRIENSSLYFTNGTTVNCRIDQYGLIWAREVKVNTTTIPDYVFQPNYNRLSLYEIETFITKYNHLPGIPSQKEYEAAGGVEVGALSLKLLEKVEEITLYLIELKKENDQLKAEIESLKNK